MNKIYKICKRPIATESKWRSLCGWDGYLELTDEDFETYCFLPDENMQQCHNKMGFDK